jgi:hypothetical protein
MCEILKKDIEMIEKVRKEKNLPKPSEFKDGRINPSDLEKLLSLAVLPFDEKAVGEGRKSGFNSRGVNYNIQLNRIQQVFGTSHVKVNHEVVEKKEVENEDKMDMIYYKTYVTVMIGNYTTYTNSDNKPDGNFVPYYDTTGIGWAGAVNEGTAEKNSRANGIKEALKNMGMLRDLYLDGDDNDNSGSSYSNRSTTVTLIEDPTIYDSGVLFMKSKAKDLAQNKEIEVIIYRNNDYNEEEHNEMIEMLNKNKKYLVEGKKLKVEYREKIYNDNMQYVVYKIKK